MTNKEIVSEWFAVREADDLDRTKNLMDSQYQFRQPMSPVPVGVDDTIAMMKMFASGFSDIKYTVEEMVEEGNHVAASGKWSAKHTGEFNGIPETGNVVEFYWLDLFKIVNGKIVNQHVEFNPMTMMAQLGATPENAK